ncbi:MAG: phosphatidylglycerol lysyltransferase domain-containing protein [Eubacteriales bacterium]|nr:phosphatidylglycerol lysyltransferase domain-containing protein [Eubacteriales bacterium]MDD4323680.1 phosphatidylglycerol lysyltransferase domain-containing protein [Eubacteriales bacterium]MDD4540658.1 phosphatidylglycerol lysyltransferase domain-containing protein [Eubacteriales bacterium]
MLEFKKLTLDTIPEIAPYLELHPQRMTDWTIGGTYIWRDAFKYEYAFVAGNLVFRLRIFDDECAFTVPLGGDRQEGMRLIQEYCDSCKGEGKLQYTIAGEADLPVLESFYSDMEVCEERDYFDYLYEANELLELKGKAHRSTRNNINRFNRIYPFNSFRVIDEDIIPEVHAFLDRFVEADTEANEATLEEASKIHEVLDNMELYRAFGAVLYAEDDLMVGFSLGEYTGDTLFVHVEKANTNYRGAYQVLMTSFVREFTNEKIVYINREDDAGDPGLRKSKLSYNPVRLIKKYTVKNLVPK